MRHLLECWSEVASRLRKAEAIALFLDFDGTLVPFRLRPEQVRLSPSTRQALRTLVRRPSLRVWVISGRRQADVRSRIGVPDVRCLGLYGWENGNNGRLSESAAAKLEQARSALVAGLQPVTGVWVEDKGAAVALHFRDAPAESVRRARAVLDRALQPLGAGLRVIDEEQAWVVAPPEIKGKGGVAREQWHAFDPRALPVYVGDGATDEPAFEALTQGVTVCVGPRRPTRARFRLRGPAEVRAFLERLEAEWR